MAEWLDENEVAQALVLSKYVAEDVQWKKHGGYRSFSVDVLSDQADYDMTLIGSITEQTGYLKFHLFAGAQPIAMLHVGKQHHNPTCDRLTAKAHKHRWTDAYREREAYVPGDMDLSSTEAIFRSFLMECNIELRGRFVAPGIQGRLL